MIAINNCTCPPQHNFISSASNQSPEKELRYDRKRRNQPLRGCWPRPIAPRDSHMGFGHRLFLLHRRFHIHRASHQSSLHCKYKNVYTDPIILLLCKFCFVFNKLLSCFIFLVVFSQI